MTCQNAIIFIQKGVLPATASPKDYFISVKTPLKLFSGA